MLTSILLYGVANLTLNAGSVIEEFCNFGINGFQYEEPRHLRVRSPIKSISCTITI